MIASHNTFSYLQPHLQKECGFTTRVKKTISDKVYMPDGADVSVWKEITDAKKQELEAQWQSEMEAEMEVVDAQE